MGRGAAVGIVLLLGIILLWERSAFFEMGYEIEPLKKHREVLIEIQQKLLIENGRLSSYQRIEQYAMDRLQMIRPEPRHLIQVVRLPASDPATAWKDSGVQLARGQNAIDAFPK